MLELVKEYEFYGNMTKQEQEEFIQGTRPIIYDKGVQIHRGDGECMGLLYVKTGKIRVYLLSENGREVTLYRLEQGEVCTLSASCILDEITFDVFIEAEEKAELLVTELPTIHKIMKNNVYVENYIYKNAMQKFSEVMWTMQQILFMSLDKRLAIFLLDESIKQGKTIKITHEQIAKYMGSAREVVSRMVKYFEKEGIIVAKRGVLEIIDMPRLRKMATE